MTTPVPPVSDPDPSALTCRGDQVGPCAVCGRLTHKYGLGAVSLLCSWCLAKARENWAPGLRANAKH